MRQGKKREEKMMAWRPCSRLSRRTTSAMTFLLVAAFVMCASAQDASTVSAGAGATAASASSSSKVQGKKVEDNNIRIRVGEASSEVSATTRRPGLFKLVGHGRLAIHKLFHHLELEVFDYGGLAANDCQLQRITPRQKTNNEHAKNATTNGAAAFTAARTTTTTSRGSGIEQWDTTKIRQRRGPGHGKPAAGGGDAPAILATFGPFDSPRLTLTCERYKLAVAEPVRYRVRLVSSPGPDKSRVTKLVIGAALIVLAPVISSWTFAYYGAGMALSVLAVVLLLLFRISRAMPGNRMMKAGAGAALFAALAVDPSHISRVLQAYASICLQPVQLVVRAVIERNPDEAGLPYALFFTFVMLVGAGLGFWVVRRWMIEPSTGEIAPSVSAFCCVAMRIVGVVLLHFSTLDLLCGAALAGCGLGVTIFEPMISRLRRKDDRHHGSSFTRTPPSAGGSRGGVGGGRLRSGRRGGGGRDDGRSTPADEDVRRRVSFGAAETPDSDGGYGGGRHQHGGGGGVSENRIGSSPFSLLSSPFGLFNVSGGEKRRRRSEDLFPDTMDPEPLTPPVVLIGTGAGAVGKSPGRTPGLGLRPWRLVGLGNMFSGGKGKGEDDTSDGWEEEQAAAAGRAAGGRAGPRVKAGSSAAAAPRGGRGRHTSAVPFAPSPLGAPFSATPRAAGACRGRGRSTAAAAGSPAPASPHAPPVYMAAAATGRFLTKAEYDKMGAEATDAGLDALCGTPEFTKWMRSQSHRIRLTREDYDDEDED